MPSCICLGSTYILCTSMSREAALLRRSFPEYFARITSVLQDVPHELILLIKTNDLVRLMKLGGF